MFLFRDLWSTEQVLGINSHNTTSFLCLQIATPEVVDVAQHLFQLAFLNMKDSILLKITRNIIIWINDPAFIALVLSFPEF